MLGVLAGLVLAWLAWEALTWPDVAGLAKRDPPTTAYIERFEEREREAGRETKASWTPVPLDQISRHLQLAALIAEDDRFFTHGGFAPEELKKALEDHLERDKPMRGASTITQQLAKNLWLSPSRNPLRKVREAILTVQLEGELDKKRILELYLNACELGPGTYGAEAAARLGAAMGALATTTIGTFSGPVDRSLPWRMAGLESAR